MIMEKTFKLLPIKSKKINKSEEKISLIDRHKKTRVFEIISYQMRKYDYLFINKKDNLKTMNFF